MKSLILTFGICLFSLIIFAQEQLYFNPIYVPHTDTTLVYTPRDYSMTSGRKYPVMFLLHGCGATYRQWNTIVSVQKYADAYGFIHRTFLEYFCAKGFVRRLREESYSLEDLRDDVFAQHWQDETWHALC